MNQRKHKRTRLPVTAIALILAAVILLAISGVQTARATLTYVSDHYKAQVEMKAIGITLMENGVDISHRNYKHETNQWDRSTGALLENMLAEGEQLKFGKAYDEKITVRNTGTIDEYVRVQLYTYWVDENGKRTDLDPSLIDLNLQYGNNGWILDESATTPERHVLYYSTPLSCDPESDKNIAPALSDTITIDPAVQATVTTYEEKVEGNRTIYTTTYSYDGATFVLEAECDGVQTHNAADAIKSAWGVDVQIDGEAGPLTLLNQQ